MATWIGLFRGINVGGHNILKMADLKRDLESLKLRRVRTYIQSGNVVFESSAKSPLSLARNIGRTIEARHGFLPQLVILSHRDLLAAIESNPFPQAITHPNTLHFFFLKEPAAGANRQALDEAKSPTEAYRVTDRVFYLHAPAGIGRSKLATNAEKLLGVTTTARNFRTVDRLRTLAAQD